jgi:hypothetical protein
MSISRFQELQKSAKNVSPLPIRNKNNSRLTDQITKRQAINIGRKKKNFFCKFSSTEFGLNAANANLFKVCQFEKRGWKKGLPDGIFSNQKYQFG